eukprot:TRINITY_DN121_c0_g3_i2.p1 TRINITY_DN121_c0_g3~~TRINITY_DN121_c0_g3_i2.p1  ORF type:complete len:235 (+),score=77.21 TRINITY_DN121_c0_g3_i2:60-764(+)
MCIRDRYQRRVRGTAISAMSSYKVVICGDGAIGKTCLLDSVLETNRIDWDDPEYIPTAAANQSVNWTVDGVGDVDFEIWDTAGQEALVALRLEAYNGTNVLLLGFDMTSKTTLDNVAENWIEEFRSECTDCQAVILVGTKSDLFEERGGFGSGENIADRCDIIEAGKNVGAFAFVATSAKTCLLYTSDAADEEDSVDLGGRRIIKKKQRKRAALASTEQRCHHDIMYQSKTVES